MLNDGMDLHLFAVIEPRVLDDGSSRASVFWVARGSSLVRVAPEHIRAEVPRERAERLKTQTDSAHNLSSRSSPCCSGPCAGHCSIFRFGRGPLLLTHQELCLFRLLPCSL